MASMRAIMYDTFGGPDVLHLQEVALPEHGPGQVRVAISAAGTNPVDAALIARKPQSFTHVEAVALPLAAGTAYEMIIRRLALTRGEWVLLYGAAGGVGSLALQMAMAQGAHVIAVARAQHHALLSALGAVACLDYTTQDVEALAPRIAGRKLDAVADFAGW